MSAIYCANCREPIESAGHNYRGETRWVHRGGNTQCQIFARPEPSQSDGSGSPEGGAS